MKPKLPAFTLIELLFALALSGLVLGMGSATYRILVSFSNRYQSRVDSTYRSMIFKDRLSLDFFNAWDFILQRGDVGNHVHLLLMNEKQKPELNYQFGDSLILRKRFSYYQQQGVQIDTFFVKAEIEPLILDKGVRVLDQSLNLEFIFHLKKRAKAQLEDTQIKDRP